jgi:predicted lipoprotein with Yx(FWY)xxD motif
MNTPRSFFFVCAGLLVLLPPHHAAAAWPTDPLANVPLCTATGDQYYPTIASDGAGGAIVTWEDKRSYNSTRDIYAQRISADGTVQWTANGVALCAADGQQWSPTIVSDGAGGAIVTWFDQRSGNYDIYAQRISADGTVQWTANGVALCTTANDQKSPTITSDGAGGAIVTWFDHRSSSFDIYAQRISAGGTVQWTADGVVLCTATGNQYYPTIASDGAGGAIVTWQDLRSSNQDIYAQRVQANGQLGGTVDVSGEASLAFALDPVRPNPVLGGTLTVRFTLASGTAASLELLDVAGRRIITREVGSLGAGRHTLDLGEGRRLAPGLYLVCLRQGTNTRVTRVAVLK